MALTRLQQALMATRSAPYGVRYPVSGAPVYAPEYDPALSIGSPDEASAILSLFAQPQTAPSPSSPVGYGADWNNLSGMVAGAWGYSPPPAPQGGARPAITVGGQPAGTIELPQGVRPRSVDQAFAQMGIPAQPGAVSPPALRGYNALTGDYETMQPSTPYAAGPGPIRTVVGKDETRLPTNAGEQAFMQAFYPQQGNAATAAIDQATATPMPRPRPDLVMPFTPSPNLRGSTPAPQAPSGGSITFKRGDTVSQLAQDRGMTTQQFAKLYGIANPNKIIAGQTVNPVGMAASPPSRVTTRTPSRTSLVSTLKSQPTERRKSIYVDEFGMVI